MLKIYDILRNEFHSSPYLPLSAFVISYISETDDYENVVKKSKDIYKKMKNEHPFLTSSEDSGYAAVNDIVEVSNYFLTCKGFGAFGIGKVQRIMYSSILVSQENKKQFSLNTINFEAVNSITNIIIAQQAAMTAVIASSAASSSVNSN